MASSRKRKTAEDNAAHPETEQHSSPAPARNAFTELMKPKMSRFEGPTEVEELVNRFNEPTYVKSDKESKAATRRVAQGQGLGEYLKAPDDFPKTRVVYWNDDFVVINDMYPKSSVHLLLLPRDKKRNTMRPTEAFDDLQFLAACRKELETVKRIVADELRRRYGKYSKTERARIEAMDSDEPPSADDLPDGRDWLKEVKCGIHRNPSMGHVHVHVMSVDMVSEPLRTTHHYHSFHDRDFFIDLEEFPLDPRDWRSRPNGPMAKGNLECWKCGRQFGGETAMIKKSFKRHLEEELDAWKRE